MINIIEVDVDTQRCGDKGLLGHIVRPPGECEVIDVVLGCYVRYALAVEDTPCATSLIVGRNCVDSDTWINPRKRARLPMARSCTG